jgi:hypothetical protein
VAPLGRDEDGGEDEGDDGRDEGQEIQEEPEQAQSRRRAANGLAVGVSGSSVHLIRLMCVKVGGSEGCNGDKMRRREEEIKKSLSGVGVIPSSGGSWWSISSRARVPADATRRPPAPTQPC